MSPTPTDTPPPDDHDSSTVDTQRRSMLQWALGTGVLAWGGWSLPAFAQSDDRIFVDGFQNGLSGLTFTLEQATPEQIGVYLPTTRAFAYTTSIEMRYRLAGETSWKVAHPLARIRPDFSEPGPVGPVDAFGGTIFDLQPGRTYDIQLIVNEIGQAVQVYTTQAATRPLPAAAGTPNKTANPGNLVSMLAGLNPGDVLELAAGNYTNLGLQISRSGTQEQPIVIRGASQAGTVLSSPSRVLQILGASHVTIENLTLQGSGTNSGTNASSRGIEFWNGAPGQTNITLRNLVITGVDVGIKAHATVRGVLVHHCTLTGNNPWSQAEIESNATWNDDGICLPGEGNCAFNNTLHGFGDAFAVIAGTMSAAVHFYRNKVTMTGDDAFEADYGTRNLGFYDNHITNCATLLSVDPVYGGPLYCFRNVAINTMRGPFKLNSTSSGFFIYNNTIVRTEGTTGWGWVQFNNGGLRNWGYRNNILIYRGSSGATLAVESTGCNPIDFTHNAWFPDGSTWWSNSGASYGTITAAIAGTGQAATTPVFGTSTRRHQFDVVTTTNPFSTAVTVGANHLVEVTTLHVPALAAGSSPKNAGIAIPNITDGYSGAAPDMGAVIAGRALPGYGASATFAPPYALPAGGSVVAIGANTFGDIKPPELAPSQWNLVVWMAWCTGVMAPEWSAGGAYVAGVASGGHADGRNYSAALFDFTDARWKRLDPVNPNATPSRDNHRLSDTTGAPYYEIIGSNGTPAARHTYQNQVWLPPALGGGPRGSLLHVTGGAIAHESVTGGAVHRTELGEARVTHSRYTDAISARTNYEGCAVFDAARSRVWNLPTNLERYRDVEYLDLSDRTFKTVGTFNWPVAGVTGGRSFLHAGLLIRQGAQGQLYAFDPGNPTVGWQLLNTSGILPGSYNVFAPWRGKYYWAPNGGGNTLTRLTPPAGDPVTGTWIIDSVTVSGPTLPATLSSHNHIASLAYVPSLDCLAWVVGGAHPVYLVRPE
ncbi:chondroitinase-B domain-containing protein [Tahibacter amnicola]|uniref:Right-handed parallel beta-helix repeat-containing protein n=1 Tax=Tahibacter amnicola TaxID=2976241 RepID=A0ABY6BLQ5_9GAMM|nr:chondroitinase-B domain-containing protein [Tahibacter amnicola]UXI70561.1 right-handed parallel beta-helix repeat-containing protein [Tahibacter amnicola]